ncbi:MAG TPA: MmcQ/YjbR family DNA-binding protein [Pseudoxanthomonas sp.]|nr:MmcQ/YjbR family DNA-binding protein [Pseudoxanthomonas sp.]
MDVAAVKAHCSRYPAASSKLFGTPSNVLAYSVGDKQFAYFKTSEPEQWRFSIRTDPERFLELTDVPGIKPARYMARFHWVTIVDVRTVPADYLQELITWFYTRALASLPKRQQSVIAGELPDQSFKPKPLRRSP